MTVVIGIATASAFFVLAVIHIMFAAVHRSKWMAAALPHVGDRPAFVPSKPATLAVALFLGGCALLVLGRIGLLDAIAPDWIFQTGTALLAMLLVARAVGDFQLVGFFKRIRGSTFARLDTWLYSPLCAVLGASCAIVAFPPGS